MVIFCADPSQFSPAGSNPKTRRSAGAKLLRASRSHQNLLSKETGWPYEFGPTVSILESGLMLCYLGWTGNPLTRKNGLKHWDRATWPAAFDIAFELHNTSEGVNVHGCLSLLFFVERCIELLTKKSLLSNLELIAHSSHEDLNCSRFVGQMWTHSVVNTKKKKFMGFSEMTRNHSFVAPAW